MSDFSVSGPLTDAALAPENGKTVQLLNPILNLTEAQLFELAESIIVAILHREGEGVSPRLSVHFGMWGRMNLTYAFLKEPSGGFLEIGRCREVTEFLKLTESRPKLKYLVMIDNDEGIEWDAPLRLAAHALPIVSGVVCAYTDQKGIFACFTAKDRNGMARFPSLQLTQKLPATGLKEVVHAGTGLLCVRRDVFETLLARDEYPFLLDDETRRRSAQEGVVKKGEDIVFCERASAAGFPIYVDFSVRAVHYKTLGLGWPIEQIDPALDAAEWYPASFDARLP